LLGQITGSARPLDVARMTVLPASAPAAAAVPGAAAGGVSGSVSFAAAPGFAAAPALGASNVAGAGNPMGSTADLARQAIAANEQLKVVTGVDIAQLVRGIAARLEAPAAMPPEPPPRVG
jgi:hypothetical protein